MWRRNVSSMRTVSILTYHSLDASGSVVSVAPQDFADQMVYLADEGLRGVSLHEAVAHREHNGSWPQRSVVLTFDDGFSNFYDSALPVLTRYGFTATVFIITNYMGGRNDWAQPPIGLGSQPILSWQQAADISAAGIEIGSHTATHPDLRRCTSVQVRHELDCSRAMIEDHLGLLPESFAYPYGGVSRASQQLAANEFRAACTTELRRANGDSFSLLPRIDMHYFRSLRRFKQLLSGQLEQYLAIRRWGRIARRMIVSDS